MGIKAALNHNKLIDQISRVLATLGWSIPTFVFALVMLLIFYARLDWFQPGRLSTQFGLEVSRGGFTQYTNMMTIDALLNLRFDIFLDAFKHLVMPVITLAVVQWALLLRVTRSSMLEEMRQDYVRTARAKGLHERSVINRHIRRNALIPVITISGATLAGLMNGVVVTEVIFNYPGLGQMAAAAAVQLDVLTMLGFALFNGFLFVGAYLVIDILYVVIDPRIRLN
jgi:peptide/nickel transport system permease protein